MHITIMQRHHINIENTLLKYYKFIISLYNYFKNIILVIIKMQGDFLKINTDFSETF